MIRIADGYLLKSDGGLHVISEIGAIARNEAVRDLGNGLGSLSDFSGLLPDRIGKKDRAQIDALMNDGFAIWTQFGFRADGARIAAGDGAATFVRLLENGKPETRHLPTDERRMVDAALTLILEPGAGPLPDGLRDATADMLKGIRKTLNEVQVKHRREAKRLADLEKYQAIPDLAEPVDKYEQKRFESLEMLEFCKAHEASLNGKLELLARAPEEFFLPIGSIVEFTGAKTAPNSLAILPDQNGEYPAAGSRGMVSALGHEREWGVTVTMRAPFKTAGGYAAEPSYERTITFRCDREQLRVVGQALLPDGTPFSGYDWMPTHGRKPSYAGDKRGEEMILEADGYFWRLHDFGRTQSIEVLQAYENIAEMSWLTGPLPQFMKEEPEEPSGPGM